MYGSGNYPNMGTEGNMHMSAHNFSRKAAVLCGNGFHVVHIQTYKIHWHITRTSVSWAHEVMNHFQTKTPLTLEFFPHGIMNVGTSFASL